MGEAVKLARLTREFAEAVASDAPLSLWPRCAEALAGLSGAARVAIVLQRGDRSTVAYRLDRGDASEGAPVVSVPIRRSTTTFGTIELEGAAGGDARAALLDACAFALAVRLDRETVPHDGERLAKLAFTDALTGIANRRSFETALGRAWSSAGRDQSPLAIAIFEIDDFDRFTNQRGLSAANECLQRAARALDDCVGRPSDVVARFGDTSFVALLVNTGIGSATELCERMRDAATQAAGTAVSAAAVSRIPNRHLKAADLVQSAQTALEEVRVG